jgi:hypothetical protein
MSAARCPFHHDSSALPSGVAHRTSHAAAAAATAPEYDLLAPGLFLDAYPLFDRMRSEAPVYFSRQLGAWVITTYEDVCDLLRDPRLSVVEELKRIDNLSAADQLALQPLKRIFTAWGNRAQPEQHGQFIKPPGVVPDEARLRALLARHRGNRPDMEMRPQRVPRAGGQR